MGPVEFTDLSWQAPPLLCEDTFAGYPLHLLFDRLVLVDELGLYEFWGGALTYLRSEPFRVVSEAGWRYLSKVLPRTAIGHARLLLPMPDGFPSELSDYTAIFLSLEVAHIFRNSTPIKKLVEDDDNYWVVTESGYEAGVRDGLPIVGADQWDIPATGIVGDLLRTPRGSMFTGCDYDLVSKTRSALHARSEQLPDFAGLDYAMQALRIIANGRHVTEIQHQVARLKTENLINNARRKAVAEAVELSKLFTVSDRARILGIYALLVPEVLSSSQFAKRLYYRPNNPPASLGESAYARFMEGLRVLQEEVNAN